MINDGIKNVPDKKIVIFPKEAHDGMGEPYVSMDRIRNVVERCEVRRDWWDAHFYRCLPLTIANTYGFLIKSEYSFEFEWNGGNKVSDLKITSSDNDFEKYPAIASHFGHGILTINTPFFMRTPLGINLLTINPPNHIVPNVTVMSGAIETDNLRRDFTFNLKVQYPNLKTHIPANTPLAAFIPIPRYFADSFELIEASEIFDKETMDEEYGVAFEADIVREYAKANFKHGVDKCYYSGKDAYGNCFKDHQTLKDKDKDKDNI